MRSKNQSSGSRLLVMVGINVCAQVLGHTDQATLRTASARILLVTCPNDIFHHVPRIIIWRLSMHPEWTERCRSVSWITTNTSKGAFVCRGVGQHEPHMLKGAYPECGEDGPSFGTIGIVDSILTDQRKIFATHHSSFTHQLAWRLRR